MRKRLNSVQGHWLGMAAWIASVLVTGCSDEPTGSTTPPDHEYSVYFRDINSNGYFYEFCPSTNSIVDSFKIPYPDPWGVQISADGSQFYVRSGDGIGIVDRPTLTVVSELTYTPGDIAFSEDNSYVAIQGDELAILRVDNHNQVYNAPVGSRGGSFSHNGRYFYFASEDSLGSFVGVVDLDSNFSSDRIRVSGDAAIWQVIPSWDNSQLMLYRNMGIDGSFFEAYDVTIHATVFREYIYPGFGMMAASPDGRFVYYTNGNTPYLNWGDCSFRVYNIGAKRTAFLVNTVGLDDGIQPGCVEVSALAITPDNQWVVAVDWGNVHLVVYDILNQRVHRYSNMGMGISQLTVQNGR